MPLLQLLLRHGVPTRGVLGERAQIGLACAAGRVNVGGLDSWLALVEQPPRTDEAPETAGHSQDVPERFARALEKTREPRGATNAGVSRTYAVVPPPICSACQVDGVVLVLPVRVRAAFALSAAPARVARSPTSPPSRWSAAGPSRRCAGELTASLVREASSACAGRVPAARRRVHARPSPTSRRGHVNRTSLQTRRPRGDDSGPATSLERRLNDQKEP